MTDLPIQKVLKKPDVAGRMVKWAVELSEFDIRYEPRGPIKGQVFADFVVELSSGVAPSKGSVFQWVLSVDGSSNQQGSGAVDARADLLAKLASSSKGGRQRTVIQETLKVPRTFVTDNQVLQVCKSYERVAIGHRSLTQETLRAPRVRARPMTSDEVMEVDAAGRDDTWITPYQRYLADGVLPLEPTEAKRIKKSSRKFTLIDGDLFRFRFTHPVLVCVHGEQCTRIMSELHEGICGSHVGGRALAGRVLRAGYYWPTLREDCVGYAQRCEQCQQHADWHKAPPEELRSIHSPWPFHTWGIDILGPFPLAIRQMKFLIVAIEYFMKWVEAEPVAQITAHKVQQFVWKNVVCRFGVPKRLVSDNGTQFTSHQLRNLCEEVGIQ
ncbi:uncharacterized protein [Phaseolus vulgaris]|uniref:uncharacterized protein n=1 Tax=Phaseolus vulgaris TaxID=3885 RepID=UPI0035CC2C47